MWTSAGLLEHHFLMRTYPGRSRQLLCSPSSTLQFHDVFCSRTGAHALLGQTTGVDTMEKLLGKWEVTSTDNMINVFKAFGKLFRTFLYVGLLNVGF